MLTYRAFDRASGLVRIPDGMDPLDAAPLLCAGLPTPPEKVPAAYEHMMSGQARFRVVLGIGG
jgi:D-arabinose 1-dehydrogenase-like Zn-dependent alcohol dehydrogenase